MGAPTAAHSVFYRDSADPRTNDTDDLGISTPTAVSEAQSNTTQNLLFDSTPANPLVTDANIVHYAIGRRANEEGAGGTMTQCKLALYNVLLLPAAAGLVTLTATSLSTAAGHKAKVTGINSTGSTLWTETLTLAAGTVNSGTTQKISEHLMVEIVASDGTTPAAAVEDVTVSVNGIEVGIVPSGYYHATTFYRIAVASAKNTALSSTDRLTAPASGIGSFSQAQLYGTVDSSLTAPDLDDTDYFEFVLEKTLRAGFPPPLRSSGINAAHIHQFVGGA